MKKYIIIFVTCAAKKEARRIARRLIDEKLIACAGIIGGLESIFRWKGKTEKAAESLIIMKSVKNKLKDIEKRVKAMHSYEVPEIIALPAAGGSSDYLKWITESLE